MFQVYGSRGQPSDWRQARHRRRQTRCAGGPACSGGLRDRNVVQRADPARQACRHWHSDLAHPLRPHAALQLRRGQEGSGVVQGHDHGLPLHLLGWLRPLRGSALGRERRELGIRGGALGPARGRLRAAQLAGRRGRAGVFSALALLRAQRVQDPAGGGVGDAQGGEHRPWSGEVRALRGLPSSHRPLPRSCRRRRRRFCDDAEHGRRAGPWQGRRRHLVGGGARCLQEEESAPSRSVGPAAGSGRGWEEIEYSGR
mmetsp:Transcript_82885/g.268624  ORF Transcript_82885/g.268624 Transcript_82885/m.268624 type:complete len:256 (+) Transcript_82885:443-1210(+)